MCQSDHFAIDIKSNLPQLPPIPPPPPRWNQDLADWEIFKNYMEGWVENYDIPNNIDDFEGDLVRAFHAAADQAMPLRQTNRYTFKDSWYYNSEVRDLKTRLNRVRKIYRKRPTDDNRETLQEVARDVTERLNQIKLERWYEWCSQLSRLSKIRDLWAWLKRVAGKNNKQNTSTHPNPQQEAERLAETFANRTNSENLPIETRQKQQQLHDQRWAAITQACEQTDDTDIEYTIQEYRATFKNSRDTAPGADKITYTMIRYTGLAGEQITLKLINKTHTERVRPRTWNQQDTQPIPKPNDPTSYRPISLLSCIEKTAEKMVLKRLIYKTGPLHPQLYAYREGVGTTECITDVLNCINNGKATAVFIDFEKAFELASAAAMLYSLVQKNVKGHLLAWTKNYSTNREARVKFQGHISEYKEMQNGTPQGGILSPFLFNILMENFANIQFPMGVDIFIYADDVVVISRGCNRVANMQRALKLIDNKAMELGLKINGNKTKAMSIKSTNPIRQLMIGQHPIEWVETYKYLGVYIDKQLTYNNQVTYLRERAKARLAPMRYMTSLKEGAQFDIQRLFYVATTRSIIDYSAPILAQLSDQQFARLEVLQNNALRLMLGAPMWTRLCNLQNEGNLPPLQTRIEIRNIHIATKAIISDRPSITKTKIIDDLNKHPIARRTNTFTASIGNIIRKHHMLDTLAKLKEDAIDNEYHPAPWQLQIAKFNHTVLPSSKQSCNIEEMRTAAFKAISDVETEESYILYTDGTVDPETETSGAAVTSENFSGCWRTSNKASTMQTELVAIKQALTYTKDNENGPVVIHCDSKSAIQALQQTKIKENKNLITSIQVLVQQHQEQDRRVTLNWIPSHIGIPGNEEADRLAKQTNKMERVQIALQPSLQQIKNSTKNIYRETLTSNVKKWVDYNSQSAKWYYKATDLIPPPIDKHTHREIAVMVHRLRLGYRASWEIINNIERPCTHCDENTSKPLIHYLNNCVHTSNMRNNIATPDDENTEEAFNTACNIAKNITQNYHMYTGTLTSHPPPR